MNSRSSPSAAALRTAKSRARRDAKRTDRRLEVSVRGVNPGNRSPRTLDFAGAARARTHLIPVALRYLTAFGPSLGFSRGGRPELRPDPTVERTAGRLRAVHVRQNLRGVPVLRLGRVVRFDRSGALAAMTGESADLGTGEGLRWELPPAEAARLAIRAVLEGHADSLEPAGLDALRDAAAEPLSMLHQFRHPDHPCVFHEPSGRWSVAGQMRVAVRRSSPEPCWEIALTHRVGSGSFRVPVLAAPRVRSRILRVHRLWRSAARAWVRNTSPDMQQDPAWQNWPDPRATKIAHLPGTPRLGQSDWIQGNRTKGPFVLGGFRSSSAEPAQPVVGADSGAGLDFAGPAAGKDDLAVVQLFHWCAFMHDFFMQLGFGEAEGALQGSAAPGAGVSGDPLLAYWQAASLIDHARMEVEADGNRCRLIATPHAETGAATALEPDVVLHEYVHAVSDRLVGGRDNVNVLSDPQGRAMSEGWSDYFALTIREALTGSRPATFGAWSATRGTPYREHAYDAAFPRTLGTMGAAATDHDRGAVWCAALLSAHDALVAALGAARGRAVAWQVVFDGMRLLHAEPTLLEAKKAMSDALEALKPEGLMSSAERVACRQAFRTGMARMGFGATAQVPSTEFAGIVESFEVGGDD